MIVDTSALIAIVFGEADWERLRHTISSSRCGIPAPVLTEFWLVAAGRNASYREGAQSLIDSIVAGGVEIIAFEQRHADLTLAARERYGKGNGRGGILNFGDLMVYAVAKDRGDPLLCAGRDFAATDLIIHPASRIDP